MGKKTNIEYIDMPDSVRNQYQYFTEADITKLRDIGYDNQITSLYLIHQGVCSRIIWKKELILRGMINESSYEIFSERFADICLSGFMS